MNNPTTTLTLTEDQLLRLLDGMESVNQPRNAANPSWLNTPTDSDREAHKALIERLHKALKRLQTAPSAPTSQRVHLPKVEALLNELL